MQDVPLGSKLSASAGALGGALESIEMPRTSLSRGTKKFSYPSEPSLLGNLEVSLKAGSV